MGLPKSRQMYAMYKGDEYIMEGTLIQLAVKRNVKLETMYYYLMPAYVRKLERRGQQNGNVIRLVSLEGDDDE